jgi:hypothetical protein
MDAQLGLFVHQRDRALSVSAIQQLEELLHRVDSTHDASLAGIGGSRLASRAAPGAAMVEDTAMRFHLRRRQPERTERPLVNDEDAAWIGRARRPFDAYDVGSLVPVVFERYARVLHPARAWPNAPVRWDAVAAWSGRTIHALAQWDFVSRPLGEVAAPSPFLQPPRLGGLPPHELDTLCSVLAAHTTTAERCFLGMWEGYGGLLLSEWASGSELRLDQRTFLVTQGPISTAARVDLRFASACFSEPPTLIWPADRAWFIASDPDLDSTYVGGSGDLIAAVLAEPGLEAWPANSNDRVSIDGDSINSM